jgi:hypothetical protein
VVHVHNADRSMHMNLHPDDIREVCEKGWGERHPMAWERGKDNGWWAVQAPLPRTFTMIYAPRSEFGPCLILYYVLI